MSSYKDGLRAGMDFAYRDALAHIEERQCSVPAISTYLEQQIASYRRAAEALVRARVVDEIKPLDCTCHRIITGQYTEEGEK